MKPDLSQIRNLGNDNPKEKIKNDILSKFRKLNAKAGHALPSRWLRLDYYPGLNPKEQTVYQQAIDELINEGLVEKCGKDNLKLTQKGVDAIY